MSIRILIFILLSISLFPMCTTNLSNRNDQAKKELKLIYKVNPFTGTKDMGHTFPGASSPFGMVQLSPETNQVPMFLEGEYNPETYRYCAGYQYNDSLIYGFSHTHFSGTGHSDLGDILILPLSGDLNAEQKSPYSAFSHDREYAEPGYYRVFLDSYGVEAELTATERAGFHRYRFTPGENQRIFIDFGSNIYDHSEKNVWTFIRVENDSTLCGFRQTNGWARTRYVYFALHFSRPVKSYGHQKEDTGLYKGFYRKFNEKENFPEMAGKDIQAWFDFDADEDHEILIKIALSSVSTEGALKNLEHEIPDWNFDGVKRATQEKWETELQKIQAEMMNEADSTTFYTAMYHASLSPVVYEDVDGKYRGLDQNIYSSDGFTNYTIFSLWDTYRALHPLFNLIQPERNEDMIRSMLAHQSQSVHKMLPVWSHWSNENWCMIGYHSVSVIADALVNGTTNIPAAELLEACVATAHADFFDGIREYKKYGYVPEDLNSNSVSKTLEYAYDDYCIARIAEIAKDSINQSYFLKRSESYRQVFDSSSGFMRPRLSSGSFRADFDPMDTHGQGFIEGNAYNYGLYVPHQPDYLVEMCGGKAGLTAFLDSIFEMELDEKHIEKNEDITRDGIIGTYVHGNEPGHHIPYLYNYSSEPWKTQERVRMIMRSMYGSGIDGLCGNDDAGQMSAWYIFSALGFYPLCPGSGYYELGSPLVRSANIQLTGGKQLRISTINQSEENVRVAEVKWNGQILNTMQLSVREMLKGGELEFTMKKN
jgi:predicted alpha-1,2-mannosidase